MDYINGSVMDYGFFTKLQSAKQYLEAIKHYKLEARHQKNIRNDWPQSAVLSHIEQELWELKDGFAKDDKDNIIEELADLINCCEILATMVLY